MYQPVIIDCDRQQVAQNMWKYYDLSAIASCYKPKIDRIVTVVPKTLGAIVIHPLWNWHSAANSRFRFFCQESVKSYQNRPITCSAIGFHFCWHISEFQVTSRQAERRLKEVQQEAAQLRNRLTIEKSNFSLDDSKQNLSQSLSLSLTYHCYFHTPFSCQLKLFCRKLKVITGMGVLEVEVFISLDETLIIVSEPDGSLSCYKELSNRKTLIA